MIGAAMTHLNRNGLVTKLCIEEILILEKLWSIGCNKPKKRLGMKFRNQLVLIYKLTQKWSLTLKII